MYVLFAFLFVACDDEKEMMQESVISLKKSHMNDFDAWIYENFTVPYNIEIKWKYEANEFNHDFHVTPPVQEKAEYFAKALLKLWIEPYMKEGGEEFIKTYVPKLIVLSGTPQYNSDGSSTLGLAEGGRKVTIFDVDNFDPYNFDKCIKAFHTMHHEFAHILHQKKIYTDEFKQICKGKYTASWGDVGVVDANAMGFITPYSMLNDNEDFVETAASILSFARNSNSPGEYLVAGKDDNGKIDNKIISAKMSYLQYKLYMVGIAYPVFNTASNKLENVFVDYIPAQNFANTNPNYKMIIYQHDDAIAGQEKLFQKVGIVRNYYQKEWGIDIMALQRRIEIAVNRYVAASQKDLED
jgi:substrate import-associated zinc metallohydrolase lipoprotein